MWLEIAACYGVYAFLRDIYRAAMARRGSHGQPQAPNYPVQPYRPQQVMPAQRARRGAPPHQHQQQQHRQPGSDYDAGGEQGELMPHVKGVWEFDVNIQGRYYDLGR